MKAARICRLVTAWIGRDPYRWLYIGTEADYYERTFTLCLLTFEVGVSVRNLKPAFCGKTSKCFEVLRQPRAN